MDVANSPGSAARAAAAYGLLSVRAERLQALGTLCPGADFAAEHWERMFALLATFREREGHVNVPQAHIEDGDRLGKWLSNQRERYSVRHNEAERKKKGVSVMPEEEVRRLESLGVVWDVFAEHWEVMYELLATYRMREGHVNVPKRHVEDGEPLGGWVMNQRERYKVREMSVEEHKKRRGRAMSDSQVQRLEFLGMSWDCVAEHRERMYGLLHDFVAREKHANVPPSHTEGGERLGVWLRTQRARYEARGAGESAAPPAKKRKTSVLSDEEMQRLEALGVVWRPTAVPSK